MKDNERKLSEYIDRLNEERRPEQHGAPEDSPELERLYSTVRLVRSLKEPALPEGDYPKKLAAAVRSKQTVKGRPKVKKRVWQRGMAGVAAVLVIAVMLSTILPLGKADIVHAMEQAFQDVKAYHGILEIVSTNAEGTKSLRSKLEVWADKEGHYYIKGLEGWQEGVITANNGVKKWQVRPDLKEVSMFPAFPDAYRFILELGNEIEQAKEAVSTKAIGEDTIAGRKTDVLEVTPQGGAPYRIWVDKETKLPLQKQTAMQNALQSTVTYTDIDFIDTIPGELLVMEVPEGYKEIEKNAEQFVNSIEEAAGIVGFTPKAPGEVPEGFGPDGTAVMPGTGIMKLYYTAQDKETRVVVVQGKAKGEFERASNSIFAKVKGSPAEVQSPVQDGRGVLESGQYDGMAGIVSIRWRQDGYEYAVVGNATLDVLEQFAAILADGPVKMPDTGEGPSYEPRVKVPVNMEAEQNEQKSVDAGHSPWRLDPVYVAQVFVSLEMSPGGITGDYPIEYERLEVVENTGVKAVINVGGDKTPIRKVYLERLVRQDSTGIWTVVGYDPA
jgi:outer membrane lipoprotein-sorting protein